MVNRLIGLEGRVFTNRPKDLDSISGRVIPKTLKMVLDTSLFNTHQGQSGAIQGKELCSPLLLSVVAIKKGAFWSPSTTVVNFTIYGQIIKTMIGFGYLL